MLRTPHCLDSLLTDGGKVVSPTHQPHSTPKKHFSASGTDLCYRLNKPQGLVRPEGLGKLKNINSPHRVSNPRLPACSIVPQPQRYRVPRSAVYNAYYSWEMIVNAVPGVSLDFSLNYQQVIPSLKRIGLQVFRSSELILKRRIV
jgi:hypothetical protein